MRSQVRHHPVARIEAARNKANPAVITLTCWTVGTVSLDGAEHRLMAVDEAEEAGV